MTNPTTPFDRALEQFKRNMQWSPQATETEKTLVLGNLNGFVAALNKTLMETTDAEILATVSPAQISEGHEIRRAALEWAADAIKAQDGGNMEAETGWKSDEALACWLTIRSMLEDAALVRWGGPTVQDPERPYCKPDQSCCDFACGN